ncbi:MAG: LysR family transcriptional regulator [Gammaproteobacteria bacterium]
MDIDALKTFVEVNRTRHFGVAARNLYVTQSTVSARIRMLESRVGVPLFTRERNNIQLTAAGLKLLRYAENILTTWSRACQEISVEDERLIPFVVGGTPSLWDAVLQEWMQHMYRAEPDLVMQAEVHGPEVLARRIQNGTMDIAFIFDAPQQLGFESVKVATLPVVMVTSIKGVALDEAVNAHYILVEWGTSFAIAHAKHFPDMASPRIRVMLGRIGLDYLLANGGTAYMAEPMVSSLLKRKKLFRVKDAPVINRDVYAIYPATSTKPALIRDACAFFSVVVPTPT